MRNGKRVKFSNGRRLVDEVIRTASKMQMGTFSRDFDLNELCALRKKVRPKISWNVLYMKAYAIIARRTPELRQCYVGFPWPYAYEHKFNVCLLTMSREYKGEERLLFARFGRPEKQSLLELQTRLDMLKKTPVEEIKQFRHQIQFAKAPALLRRMAWWLMLNVFPQKRMSHFGTFGMTLSCYKDSYANQLLGPNTTILGVDVLPKKGISRFLLTFDHQIMDGVPVIKIIDELYKVLNTQIAQELRSLLVSQVGAKRTPKSKVQQKSAA